MAKAKEDLKNKKSGLEFDDSVAHPEENDEEKEAIEAWNPRGKRPRGASAAHLAKLPASTEDLSRVCNILLQELVAGDDEDKDFETAASSARRVVEILQWQGLVQMPQRAPSGLQRDGRAICDRLRSDFLDLDLHFRPIDDEHSSVVRLLTLPAWQGQWQLGHSKALQACTVSCALDSGAKAVEVTIVLVAGSVSPAAKVYGARRSPCRVLAFSMTDVTQLPWPADNQTLVAVTPHEAARLMGTSPELLGGRCAELSAKDPAVLFSVRATQGQFFRQGDWVRMLVAA